MNVWMEGLWALVVVGYLAAACVHALVFVGQGNVRPARRLAWAVWVAHSALLGWWCLTLGELPLDNLPVAIMFCVWLATLNFLIADAILQLTTVGAFYLPLAFLCAFVSASPLLRPTKLSPGDPTTILIFHVAVALAAYAAFTLCFVAALMYLLQERQLQGKVFSIMYRRLPSLGQLDHVAFWWGTMGFALLTVGMWTGFVFSGRLWGTYWNGDPKEWWTLITWLVYAAYLSLRWCGRLHCRQGAWLAMAGFAAVMVNLVVVSGFWSRSHLF